MASVHTNTYGGRTITLEVVEESWSIETNTSVVRWTLRSGTSSTYHSVYQITAWVGGTDDAHKVYGPKTADWSSRAFPCKDGSTTGTVTVQHNADGTASPLTFRLRGSVYNNNPQNYDGSINLTTIPRATTDWSISGDTIGSNVTVTLRPNSSSFTHRVICYFGNDSQELSVASNQQSASATIKMAFCNQVPNATSGSGTMVVETYNAGQLIGSNSKPITLNVPSDVGPTTPSITTSDTAGYLSTYGAYVQGKSNLRVVTSSSGSYSSSISNVTVNIKDSNNNVLRQLTGSDVTLSSISYVGNLTIQVVVTDTRGRQASNTSSISVVEYFNPRINSFNAERRNNDSTVTITFSADICNINNNNVNSKEFRLYKRQKGTSSWGSPILTYNSAYSYSRNDFTTTCDENYGWEFLLQAQDSFTTTNNDNPEVGTAFELINWGADGTSMAIGKVSEHSNTLEVALKTVLNDDVDVANANIRGDAIINGLITTSTHKQYYLPAKVDPNYGEYYLLAKLPLSDTANHSMIRVSGVIGGWASSRKTFVDFIISIRDGRRIEGDFYGSLDGFGWFEFKLHEASDGWYIYLRRKEQYTGEVILDVMLEQGTWYGETTSSSPVGTDRETINQYKLGTTFKNRTIPSNNLDDWLVVGSYVFDNHGDYYNTASTDGICIVNVYNNNGDTSWVIQEYHRMLYHNTSTDKWIRQRGAGVWSNWQKIV